MTDRDPTGWGRGVSRRQAIRGALGGLAACAAASPGAVGRTQDRPTTTLTPMPKARYCLNTSTIRGQDSQIGVVEQIRIAGEAGYDGIEPWLRDIDRYAEQGGSLRDLAARIGDAGLAVPSAIGFARWAVDDDAERAEGLEQAKRDMATIAEIGGTRIAAPPVGLTDRKHEDLLAVADRYATLLELGERMGVVPQLEVWGFSKTFSRLGEVAFVAVESGRADACILPDVYHVYKGGSSFEGLRHLSGRTVQVFHLNDYPADPPRETITDADRVFPGDGVAPLGELMAILDAIGFDGTFSLELFNRDYWQRDPMEVAREGLRKMKQATGSGA